MFVLYCVVITIAHEEIRISVRMQQCQCCSNTAELNIITQLCHAAAEGLCQTTVRPLSGHCHGVGVRVTLLAGLNSEALSCQCQLSGLCQGVVRVRRPSV